MRDQNNGVALTVQAGEESHDFFAGTRIEVAGRLIGEHDGRRIHEGASDCDALALSTGKFVGLVVHAIREIDAA